LAEKTRRAKPWNFPSTIEGWTKGEMLFSSHLSRLTRGPPEHPGGPGLMLEFDFKRLDFFIASAADVFSFPYIISGI